MNTLMLKLIRYRPDQQTQAVVPGRVRLSRLRWVATRTGVPLERGFICGRGPAAVLLAVVSLIASECASRVSRPPDQPIINKMFDVVPANSPQTPTHDLDLYIDGSESMMGFAKKPNSRYQAVVGHVLDNAGAGQYRMSRFKFSTNIENIDNLPTNEILAESFYHGADTPLSQLLERVAKNPVRIAIIVSDMVQSDKGKDVGDLSRAIGLLAEKHMELLLLGFRSSFEGPYVPENRLGGAVGKFTLKVPAGLPNTGRPFFVFVIAPDRPSLESVKNLILGGANAVQTFSPTESPIANARVDIVSVPKAEAIWNKYSTPEQKPLSSGGVRQYGSFREYNAPRGKDSPLQLRLSGVVRIPFESAKDLKAVVRRASFQTGRPAEKPAEADVPVKFEENTGQEQLSVTITYPFRRPASHVWDVYEIKIYPAEGGLRVPTWVRNWSTTQDDRPEFGNRTFKLESLVKAMIVAITERNAFCEQYIAVGRD